MTLQVAEKPRPRSAAKVRRVTFKRRGPATICVPVNVGSEVIKAESATAAIAVTFGKYADEPLWDDLMAAIEADRRELNEIVARQQESGAGG